MSRGDGRGKGRDLSSPSGPVPGIKIKGQAQVERQRNKTETGEVCYSLHVARVLYLGCSLEGVHDIVPQNAEGSQGRPEDLSRRESELKEKALRNKVVRTRKRTTSNPPTESSGAP